VGSYRQEREQTTKPKEGIVHANDTHWILNTTVLRNGGRIRKLLAMPVLGSGILAPPVYPSVRGQSRSAIIEAAILRHKQANSKLAGKKKGTLEAISEETGDGTSSDDGRSVLSNESRDSEVMWMD